MRKVKKKVNLGILGVSPYVSKGVPQSCVDQKNFECYKIHFERVARKLIIILNQNLVEFLYSHFCMFERSQVKHNSLDCHKFFEYFPIISSLHVQSLTQIKKKNCMFKALKP